jgi:hypothetical protein
MNRRVDSLAAAALLSFAAASAALAQVPSPTAALDPPRRASAARLLEPWARSPEVATALREAAHATDPWVRASAVRSLGATLPAPDDALDSLAAATTDPDRVVRLEAAFALRGLDVRVLDPDRRRPLEAAFAEWLGANAVLADLPETAHTEVGCARGARMSDKRGLVDYPPILDDTVR